MKKYISIFIISITMLLSCNRPDKQIIKYAENKYGTENFSRKKIDLKKIFTFNWDELYIFPPLSYPEDITKATGITYTKDVTPDDTKLYIFIYKGKIIKQDIFQPDIGFCESEKHYHLDFYKINSENAIFYVTKYGKNNFWLCDVK